MHDERTRHGPAVAWTAAIALLLAAAGLLLLSAWPQSAPARWLSMRLFFAQAIAFPRIAGIAAVVFALIVLWGMRWFRRRSDAGQHPGARNWPRRLTLGSLCAIAASGALLLAFPVSPSWSRGPQSSAAPESGSQLSVVTLNTQESLTGRDLAELRKKFDPGIIILPETSEHRLTQALDEAGLTGDYTIFGTTDAGFTASYTGSIAPTSVLVSNDLEGYGPASGPATTFGTVTLESSAGLPRIAGVHTAPPMPSLMSDWSADLNQALAWGERADGPTIVGGDFNATLRHGPMASRTRMVDAAEECGAAGRGTWPARQASWATTPIDHIFVTPDIGVDSCDFASIGEGDHSALAVTLRVP